MVVTVTRPHVLALSSHTHDSLGTFFRGEACEQMGQTRPQVMAARQQLSSVLPGAHPLPLHPMLPLSLTRAPFTPSLSLRPSTIKWPRQQRAFSLPKCQFLGNRAGTRAITAGCQLNANEQPGSDWRCKTHTHTHIRRTFIPVVSTISMDNWCKPQLRPTAGDLQADTHFSCLVLMQASKMS